MEGCMVGIDGSKASEAALRWASPVAATSGLFGGVAIKHRASLPLVLVPPPGS